MRKTREKISKRQVFLEAARKHCGLMKLRIHHNHESTIACHSSDQTGQVFANNEIAAASVVL